MQAERHSTTLENAQEEGRTGTVDFVAFAGIVFLSAGWAVLAELAGRPRQRWNLVDHRQKWVFGVVQAVGDITQNGKKLLSVAPRPSTQDC